MLLKSQISGRFPIIFFVTGFISLELDNTVHNFYYFRFVKVSFMDQNMAYLKILLICENLMTEKFGLCSIWAYLSLSVHGIVGYF